jgi:cell division transport system permease protein
MTRRRIDIPFDRDGSGRFLPWLIALMVYLAALAASGALALDRALASWDRGLAGALTIELPPASDAAGSDLDRTLAAIRAAPGVTAARALGRDEVAKLLEPWLGGDLPQALALPRLIDVRVERDRLPDPASLAALVAAAAPGAEIDDHRTWLGRLAALVRSAEATAVAIVLLIGGAAVLTVIFTTRTGLSVHRDAIELLHLMGARDGYIAAQFDRHALRLGLAGGALGIALAVATLLLLGQAGDAASLLGAGTAVLPRLGLSSWDYAVLAALPVAAALLAMATARLTVLRALARMP